MLIAESISNKWWLSTLKENTLDAYRDASHIQMWSQTHFKLVPTGVLINMHICFLRWEWDLWCISCRQTVHAESNLSPLQQVQFKIIAFDHSSSILCQLCFFNGRQLQLITNITQPVGYFPIYYFTCVNLRASQTRPTKLIYSFIFFFHGLVEYYHHYLH